MAPPKALKPAEGKKPVARGRTNTLRPPVVEFTVRELVNHRLRKRDASWPDDLTAEPRWIYIFTVESWGVRLRYEAKVEGDVKYKLVDWSGNTWEGKDERPATKDVTEFKIRARPEQIHVMVSRIQLPRVRLQQYVGNTTANPGVKSLVKRRCTALTEKASARNDFENGEWVWDDKCSIKPLGPRIVFVPEPIHVADKTAYDLSYCCRRYREHRESSQAEYMLAQGALSALGHVLKSDDDFVSDGKFKAPDAKAVRDGFQLNEKKLRRLREAAGERHRDWTMRSEYVEAINDFDGVASIEEQGVGCFARHSLSRMQSKATRDQMLKELQDPGSWVMRYLKSENLFQTGRKLTNMAAEFGDILGEYGPMLYRVTPMREVKAVLVQATLYRTGVNISAHFRVKVIMGARFDVVEPSGFKSNFPGKAAKVLVAFEAINLGIALKKFSETRHAGVKDYAEILGSLADMATSAGAAAKAYLEQQEKLAAAQAGRKFTASGSLVRLGRVIAVIGVVGGVCDMYGAYNNYQDASARNQYEHMVGYAFMGAGATLGTGAGIAAMAGASVTGVGIVAVALVVIGIGIISWFNESELETWLRNSKWGDRPLGKSIHLQMASLDYILARFAVTLEYKNLKHAGFGTQMSNDLYVTIRAGMVRPKSKFTVRLDASFLDHDSFIQGATESKTIDKREFSAVMDRNGRPQPITYKVDLSKRGGFQQRIRVHARLDLAGDGKTLVPKKDNAFWAYFFEHAEGKFKETNSYFE